MSFLSAGVYRSPFHRYTRRLRVVGGWERRWRLRNWLRFVADQRDGHPGTGVHPGLPKPLANVQERATVGNVVHEHARRRTRIVRPGYRPESLLAGRVPHSYFDLPAVQRQRLVSVVHACGKRDFRLHFRGGLLQKGVGLTQQASMGPRTLREDTSKRSFAITTECKNRSDNKTVFVAPECKNDFWEKIICWRKTR